MNAGDIIKLALVAAVVLVLFKVFMASRAPPAPKPFDGEWYDDSPEDEEGFDEDDDDDDDDETFDEEIAADYASAAPRSEGGLFATSVDLLPKPGTAQKGSFAEFAPKALKAQNFLDCSRFVGVNTQGSSLRNASRDLRAAPVIPRAAVGPWSQSTIEADLLRKPLE